VTEIKYKEEYIYS